MKIIFFLILFLVHCNPTEKAKNLIVLSKEKFGILPDKMPFSDKDTIEKVELGRKLFFDPRISSTDTLSCNGCHNLLNHKAGVDNLTFSKGAYGKLQNRNTPTVLNAGYHIAQYWDGRAENLEEQIIEPIFDINIMGIPDEKFLITKIYSLPDYIELIQKAYPKIQKISIIEIAESLAAFQRTLKTHDRFDEFQKGDWKILTVDELKGLELFIEYGCVDCHNGPLLGGNSFKKLGKIKPYENVNDLGLYEVTKEEKDKHIFKVPSLRNITMTAPYFHDGSVRTLDMAIKKMGIYQLGKTIPDDDVEKIISFLNSLTDKQREN